YARMLQRTVRPGDFSSLRVAGFASFGPQSAATAHAALALGIPMRGLYGSSELQALFAMQNPSSAPEERLLPGGLPADPAARVRVIDSEAGDVLDKGLQDRLEIYSPSAFEDYFAQPDAYREAFTAHGYFRTADIGYTRADGSFVFQARAGDAMRLSG